MRKLKATAADTKASQTSKASIATTINELTSKTNTTLGRPRSKPNEKRQKKSAPGATPNGPDSKNSKRQC